MAFRGGRTLMRYLWLTGALALLLFLSTLWLPQGGARDCENSWHPCLSLRRQRPDVAELPLSDRSDAPVGEGAGSPRPQPAPPECPGQSFQVWRLLLHLRASLAADQDILLEPYLQSWEELIKFMESLGVIITFFSQKVKDKVALVRELSLTHSRETSAKSSLTEVSAAPPHGPYHSVASMVEAELKSGVVSFSRRTESGCRTLLRLHRSLQWLRLLMAGLAEGPNAEGEYKTPGELCREAYMLALAPHHPWVLRQAAELLFVALPDRELFLRLACVGSEREAAPVLRALLPPLAAVHERTQRILQAHGMLELP